MSGPEAWVAHRIAGRVRLEVPSARRDREFFARAQSGLGALPGVEGVYTNPLTGAIVLHFSGKWASLRERIAASSVVSLRSGRQRRGDSLRRAFEEIDKLDQRVEEASEGELSLSSLVGLVLIGLGGFQALRRDLLPPASTLVSEGLWMLSKVNSARKEAEKAARKKAG